MSTRKKIMLALVALLAIGLGIFAYMRRKPAADPSETPTGGKEGSNSLELPATPATPPPPGTQQPSQQQVQQAVNEPAVPSLIEAKGLFSPEVDWRTLPQIKALWKQRKQALADNFVTVQTADQDPQFFPAAAKALASMVSQGILSFNPLNVNAKIMRIGTTDKAVTIFLQLQAEGKLKNINTGTYQA